MKPSAGWDYLLMDVWNICEIDEITSAVYAFSLPSAYVGIRQLPPVTVAYILIAGDVASRHMRFPHEITIWGGGYLLRSEWYICAQPLLLVIFTRFSLPSASASYFLPA